MVTEIHSLPQPRSLKEREDGYGAKEGKKKKKTWNSRYTAVFFHVLCLKKQLNYKNS